jgi:hypothetical protein
MTETAANVRKLRIQGDTVFHCRAMEPSFPDERIHARQERNRTVRMTNTGK